MASISLVRPSVSREDEDIKGIQKPIAGAATDRLRTDSSLISVCYNYYLNC